MSRDTYFDMCEQLGNDPVESEIPIELEDLPIEAQEAWKVYSYLPDRVDSFNGVYHGKSIENVANLMSLFGIDDKQTYLLIVTLFDKYETEEIKRKKR